MLPYHLGGNADRAASRKTIFHAVWQGCPEVSPARFLVETHMPQNWSAPRCVFALVVLLLCTSAGCPKPKAQTPVEAVDDRAKPGASTLKKFDATETAELLRLRGAALGHLENQKFADAEAALRDLAKQLPDELFVWQNLAVCQQLAFDATKDDAQRGPLLPAVEDTLAEFERRAPSSAAPFLLRARIADKLSRRDEAIAALRAAVQAEPDAGPAWYELYSQLRIATVADANSPGAAKRFAQMLDAGRQVDRFYPENWFVWKDWALDLAQAKDPDLKPLLKRMRTALAPFASTFERDVHVNPVTVIDNAVKTIDGGTSPNLRILANILISEVLPDKAAVSKHSLEYLRRDFSVETAARFTLEPVVAAPAAVQFDLRLASLAGLDGSTVRALVWVDADLDRRMDLAVLESRKLTVFRMQDSGWSEFLSCDLPGDAVRLSAADLDDDGDPVQSPLASTTRASPFDPERWHEADPDFVASGPGGLFVVENRLLPNGVRQLVVRDENQPWIGDTGFTTSVLADLDGDGDLDLFASNPRPRIFSQRGNLLFQELTERSLLPDEPLEISAAVCADWDRDVDTDVIVTSGQGFGWFENLRHGRFRYRALPWEPFPVAMQLTVAELNGDGAWELVAAGPRGLTVITTRRSPTGVGAPDHWGTLNFNGGRCEWAQVADFDNDGAMDILSDHPDGPRLSVNDGLPPDRPAGFHTVTLPVNRDRVHAAAVGDIDRDGDVDAWLADATVDAVRNDGGNANHWLELRVRGLQEKGASRNDGRRINHQGIGSLVELRTGERYQAAIVDGQVTHFGLGKRTKPDLLRMVWTNGVPLTVVAPPADHVIFEEQLPTGSCPYLYLWNGERFEFYTDLLWNAPLGLKFAEDVVAPWREWEYLKLDGDRLQPRENQYVLQITEELWEVAYFDQVQLTAIDHPRDVQIFTNEKVGPASMAEPKLHTVRQPRPPVAARDTQGRDVLSEVLHRDGTFTKTYDRKLASGLTTDHYLELDFGDLGDARQITLFLTGWLYPTTTSQNVQLSLHPTMPRPRPPSLWTPDETGAWREIRPFMGFPGGKTKTIAVDVSDCFTPGDYRLRIATNMEFYWDDAFVTVDEAPAEFVSRPLEFLRADLHARGFSQAVHHPGNGPEHYDYGVLSTEPRWPPLAGQLTRYGDVTELLRQRDDHLAVFGAGDEMTVAFAVPKEPLPEGWVRDFVLFNVGWDKDTVLHTVHGTTIEPLPFRAMTEYGHIHGESRPMDVDYARYLERYQTRRQDLGAFWNQLHLPDPARNVLPRSRFDAALP